MVEYLEELKKWNSEGRKWVVARVIQTWGSSPRPAGSIMLINDKGKILGSVSGGCVEGEVTKHAAEVLEKGVPRNIEFGVSDEDAWSVGLSCGGRLKVFLEIGDSNEVWASLIHDQAKNQSGVLVSSLEDGENLQTYINMNGCHFGDPISAEINQQVEEAYTQRCHKLIEERGKQYFIQVFPRKSILLIIGAAHITVDLVKLGNMYGFETVVIDPRGYFTENTVFSDPPSRIIEAYPSEVLDQFPLDAYTFSAILSHDPKIDDNALEILLKSDVGYIGALGSRKTHEKRVKRLSEKGIEPELIDRIHAPIGTPINANSAREIALSIIGQIIQVKNEYSRKKK